MNNADKTIADRRLAEYLRSWRLTPVEEPIYRNCSLLQRVTYNGADAILKIAMEAEEQRGALVMAWWNGDGTAKVLRYDSNALLLEYITGDHTSLTEMATTGDDNEATRIICSVAKKLHGSKQCEPDFKPVSLREWFKNLWPAASKYGGILPACATIAEEMLNSQQDIVVLHGDIHHQNVLYSHVHGWVAIDPKGLSGDRAFDYANIFCNPDIHTALQPGRFERQWKIVSSEAQLEPVRLLKWAVAWCGLSASWILDEPQEGDTPELDLGVAAIGLDILEQTGSS